MNTLPAWLTAALAALGTLTTSCHVEGDFVIVKVPITYESPASQPTQGTNP